MDLEDGRRSSEEADFTLDSVTFDSGWSDERFQGRESRHDQERDRRRIRVHREADSAGAGADAGYVRMRVGSFKAGQQQDERDARERSEAPEETRAALAFRNHTLGS
jgi:hypothetical protein